MNKIDVIVPVGQSGKWTVSDLTITPLQADLANLRAEIKGEPDMAVMAGDYKVLKCGYDVVMSNTQMEVNSHMKFINQARGDVLINGLGLGMALSVVMDKPEVTSVTVIELSNDVITLVAPTYQDHPKVTIIQADALTYEPPKGKRYDVVWHDIWPTICPDNLDDMDALIEKYHPICNWQAAWKMDECEDMQRVRNMFGCDY